MPADAQTIGRPARHIRGSLLCPIMQISPTVAVRLAGLADAAAVAGCFDMYRRYQGTPGPDRAQWEQIVIDEMQPGRSQFFVVGAPAHSVAMMSQFWSPWRSGFVGQVGYVWCDPLHRRRGIGRALIEACETDARDRGFMRMELHVNEANTAALNLYTKAGWRDDNSAYDGQRDIRYYKDF